MFLTNPKGPKDTMQSLFQAYGEHNIKNNKHSLEVDKNIAALNQLEKNAENKSFRSFLEKTEQEKKMDKIVQVCSTEPHRLGICKMFQVDVDNVNGNAHLSEEMQKVKEAEIRELKLREQICRDSPELTELNNKLHQAVVRKDMELQLQEKENKKQEEKMLDQFYREQLCSATQRQMMEAEAQEKLAAQRKTEYRRALEEQMATEAELKRQEKYRRFLEEQTLTQAEIDRMIEEDKKSQAEKANKTQRIREDMQEDLKLRKQVRQEEKLKNQELEQNVVSYWEESTRHEQELKQERLERQKLITQRQEQCAQSLQEINQRTQTRADLMDNITVMTQLASEDNDEHQIDLEIIDRKLKQSQLCSQLDGQVADKVRNEQTSRRENQDFQETWIWGDVARQKCTQEAKWREQREIAEYNRATVREHEEARKRERYCNGDGDGEAEVMYKQKLIEEEKERLLKVQRSIDQ